MNSRIEILKGVHPGLFLQRELDKRKLKSGHFAESIGEHPQTISAIIRGRRAMNTPLSLRIEQSLGLEEGFLMTLQVFYDIAQEKIKLSKTNHPDLAKYRHALFWGTELDRIDWSLHRGYIINRVFERGNEDEILETIRFYGKETIIDTIRISSTSPFESIIRKNLKQYLQYES